jgi:hypothetical protein
MTGPTDFFGTGPKRRDPEVKCARCSLWLAPGSSHTDAQSCVEALRAALDLSNTCDGCGAEMGTHCVSCKIKQAALNKGAELGMSVFARAQQRLQGKRQAKKGEGSNG